MERRKAEVAEAENKLRELQSSYSSLKAKYDEEKARFEAELSRVKAEVTKAMEGFERGGLSLDEGIRILKEVRDLKAEREALIKEIAILGEKLEPLQKANAQAL